MTKKTRGPSGRSVLPRAAQDDKPRGARTGGKPARPDERSARPAGSGFAQSKGPGFSKVARPKFGAARREDEERPRREGAGPRSSGPRREGAGPRSAGPRREGTGPRSTGPRREGTGPRSAGPRREGAGPRSTGPRERSITRERSPEREGGYTRKPASTGPRREGTGARSFSPRREGAAPRGEGFKREGTGPRREGTGPRTGGFKRAGGPPREGVGPRREGTGPRREGTGPRRESTGPRTGGFKRAGAPSRAGAPPRAGGPPRRAEGAPSREGGPRRPEGGYKSGYRRDTGPKVPRDARGPRRRPTEATGKRHARPTRFDATTGRPILAGVRTQPPVRIREKAVGVAPQASAPRRGPNVRDLALQTLFQVQVKRAFAERVIDDLAEQFRLDQRDRGFLNELVKGTLRRRGTIDWHLNRLLHVGLSSLPLWIQNGLRLGAYQLLWLDRIPPRAAVDEAVKLALKYGHPGTAGLSNSVLRKLADAIGTRELPQPSPLKDDGKPDLEGLVAITSHPRWLVERWVERFGVEETLALCEANNRSAALGLRVNRLKLDRKELIKRLEAAGLDAQEGRWSDVSVAIESDADFGNFPSYARGDCTVQDESETMVSILLAPKSGERVLDLCAAPGGKSTHLAELMGDTGEIVSVEKMPPRARSMQRQVERLGMKSIKIETADGTEANLLEMGKGDLYDKALVDAPCSSLGVLARRADARWRKEAEGFPELAELQGKLLRAAARVVRPGGALVYSVCSFEPEETDAVIASFLAGHPEWSKDDAANYVPAELAEQGGSMRILPHRHGTDGAFAARLVRKA